MTKKLEDKTAVITGGTEGIGFATAKLFVKEGAYVFITGRRQKELDEAVKALGTSVSGVQRDVAQLADLDRLYETVANVKGRIAQNFDLGSHLVAFLDVQGQRERFRHYVCRRIPKSGQLLARY
jgi:NAD(P)-dependent dehydrogenase (short-subunit alcohol dehydrogenase family)